MVVDMQANAKKLGILIRHAPYGNLIAQEAIDAVLATSVYGQMLSVIFVADGVLQLLDNHHTEEGKNKSIEKQLSAFELYDIDRIFVCQQSLDERGIDQNQLSIKADILDTTSLSDLLHEQEALLSF